MFPEEANCRTDRPDQHHLAGGEDYMSLRMYDLAGAEPARRFSPYCWRVRLALAHKELAVETIPWRFTEKAEIAPSDQIFVPVLVDDDRWIADSCDHCELSGGRVPGSPVVIWAALPGDSLTRFYSSFADGLCRCDFSVCRA